MCKNKSPKNSIAISNMKNSSTCLRVLEGSKCSAGFGEEVVATQDSNLVSKLVAGIHRGQRFIATAHANQGRVAGITLAKKGGSRGRLFGR